VTILLEPNSDTLRGGRAIVISSDVDRFVDPTTDVSLLREDLPVGWTTSVTGRASVQPTFSGLLLSVGSTAGTAEVVSPTTYTAFDATLRLRTLLPAHPLASVVLAGRLRFIVGSSIVDLHLRRDSAFNADGWVGSAVVTLASGEVVQGAQQDFWGNNPLDGEADFELRIVRSGAYVFAFINDELLLTTDRFTPTGPGALRVLMDNGITGMKVTTRLTALEVRSHALINGRLLDQKVDFATQRLTGLIPPAPLAELGPATIILFGPWGTSTLLEGLNYVLPPGISVGHEVARRLNTYDDPVIKD
jgi:hypothetical protein